MNMRCSIVVLLFFIIFILPACSITSNLSKDYTVESNDALIVMGVYPRYRIMMHSGRYDGEYWKLKEELAVLNLYPEDGYIVAKLPPLNKGEAYAITQILPRGIFRRSGPYGFIVPCDNMTTLSFNTVEGQVLYLGELNFEWNENRIVYSFDTNIESARNFLKAKYPSIADKLVMGETRILPTKFRCELIKQYM